MIGPTLPQQAAFSSPLCGMNVKFSPFEAFRLAFPCAENFGIVGKGKLLILDVLPEGRVACAASFDEPNAVFDCAWSEVAPNLIMIALGDGNVKLIDTNLKAIVHGFKDHQGEVYSVDASHQTPNLYLSSGFDGMVKLWDVEARGLVNTFAGHVGCVYSALWHPNTKEVFGSCSADSTARIWDIRDPRREMISIKGHFGEILSMDFNKYKDLVATGSIDKSIKLWDLRNLAVPALTLNGHKYAVRRVKCSPHEENIILSGSYDMSVIVWDTAAEVQKLAVRHSQHTEFVLGIDFNLFNKRQIASTSWDGRVYVWNWDLPQPKV
eukprot:TRINITY_DN137_c0_g3_i4.p1 TRINITY_DN137_c0_g3~~TRINITY_DN137_c0_g3_i4.p1  ORF type:complete len:323 (-),score=53.38 TRINITY_DN137_c0_g3_i4:120-1088(-)